MADNKQHGSPGTGDTPRDRARAGATQEGAAAAQSAARDAQAAGREAAQSAARGAAEALHHGGELTQRGGEAMGEAARRTGDAVGEVARRTGDAAGEVSRRTAEAAAEEAARRAGEAIGEAARRGAQALAGGQRRALDDAAQAFEETGRRLSDLMREAAEGMRSMVAMPGLAGDGMREAQQALARLVDGVVTTNVRAAQELLRRSGPGAVVELQQRFLRDYFDALAEGGTVLLRATRRAAEESLRPLEEQIERRARARPSGGGHPQTARVADVMTAQVRVASPNDTVQQAARLMAEEDTGVLPVREGDRLVGMVTDRDLAVRVAAEGKDPTRTRVSEVMSQDVRTVFEDEPIEHAAEAMAEQQVRRLPVVDREERLVGIVSLGDIAGDDRIQEAAAGQALRGVSREGGPHRQQRNGGPGQEPARH